MQVTVLEKSDVELYRFVAENEDAVDVARRLCQEHVFSVTPVAVLRMDYERFLQSLSKFDAGHGWYATSLVHIVTHWAMLREEEGVSDPPQTIDSQESEETGEIELPHYMLLCSPSDAPLVSEVRKSLTEKVGKSEAKKLVAHLKVKRIRRNTKVASIFTFAGSPVKLSF